MRVDVVVARDRADGDRRDPRPRCGSRRRTASGSCARTRAARPGDICPVETSTMSQPRACSARAKRDGVVAVEAAGHPVRRRDPHATSASPPATPRARRRRPRAGTASGSRASRRTRRCARLVSGERKRRQQVAVRHVQLEQVEARRSAHAGPRATNSRAHRVHVGAGHLARHLAVRRGTEAATGAMTAQLPVVERLVDALPHQLRRALAAGVAELDRRSSPSLCACTKSTIRRHASTCSSFHMPAQPGRDPARRRDADHLGHHQPRAAERARRRGGRGGSRRRTPSTAEYMSIGETTTRFGSSSSRSRNG